MKLSVVILNYNVQYYLHLCLQSVMRALEDMDSEIIVVDNASADDSVAMIKNHFPEVILLENTENLGFSKGNNIGVSKAKGEFVCILNPDTVLPESCFKELLLFAEQKNKPGAFGIQLIDGSGNFLPESKRNVPTPLIAAKKMLGLNSGYYAEQVGEQETGTVPVLVGALMLLRKSVYDEVHGFDEDYFMYGEDIDLSYRLMQKGYTNYYYGAVSAIHFKGESTRRNRKYYERFYGAMQIFYRKHFKKSNLMDRLIGLGLWIAKRKGSPGTEIAEVQEDQQLLWVGSDAESIPFAGSAENFQVDLQTPEEALKRPVTVSKLILDAGSLSYLEVIDLIQQLKNKGNRFRIRPSNCNFSIGSDSSLFPGQIIKWESD